MFNVRRRRRRHEQDSGEQRWAGLEPLESRVLMHGSDLAVTLTTLNAPVDPMHRGDAVTAGVTVSSVGTTNVTGNVTVQLFLSRNGTFDSTDLLVAELIDQPVNLDPATNTLFPLTGSIPANARPGAHQFIARIIPATAIGDTEHTTNHTDAEGDTAVLHALHILFGLVGEQANVAPVVNDNSNFPVTFSLTGPGTGTITDVASTGFTLSLADTTSASKFKAAPNSGTSKLKDVTVPSAGGLKSFNAKAMTLTGTATFTGPVGSAAILGIAGGTINANAGLPKIAINNFTGTLNITGPIQSFKGVIKGGKITAESIRKLTGDRIDGIGTGFTTLDLILKGDGDPTTDEIVLKLLKAKTFLRSINIFAAGSIGKIIGGLVHNFHAYAGIDTTTLPANFAAFAANPLFQSTLASIRSFTVKGIKGGALAQNLPITNSENIGLAAPTIMSAAFGNYEKDAGGAVISNLIGQLKANLGTNQFNPENPLKPIFVVEKTVNATDIDTDEEATANSLDQFVVTIV